MRLFQRTTAAAILLLFGAAGCADLEVVNPNDPTRDQALATAGDVESLIAGSYNTWMTGTMHWSNVFWLSNAAFQSSSSAANAGNIDHSAIPREAVKNEVSYDDYDVVVERTWQRSYRALAAVADGLRTLDNNADLAADLGAADENRVRAWGKFMQGLGHATLALWYDQAYIIDEATDIGGEQTAVDYNAVMAAASGYFDDAIQLASGQSWEIPAGWIGTQEPVDNATFIDLIYSWRALFTASLPRTPSETVNWTSVISDLDNGLSDSFDMYADASGSWYVGAFDIVGGPNGWGADSYFIIGMADQSGDYQRWLAEPLADRQPWFGATQGDDPFLIQTPDTRFPQGTTLTEQIANPGEYYVIPTEDGPYGYGYSEHMENPGRGTWRWSYYYYPTSYDYWYWIDFNMPVIEIEELNLLRAEALMGTDPAAAAAIINQTRTAHGLNATDAAGTNTSCVPKLPDGTCGGLMEMLKWEKRLETRGTGALMKVSWFWDARRWGDHYRGTPLHLPIPAQDLQVLQLPLYTWGGPTDSPPGASAGSSYAWPGE
jgi:hypothetical protein